MLPICTFCSDNAARPGLLWSGERRATVIAAVIGERPGRPPTACRNNIGVIGAPTDIGWNCGLTNWSFFWLQFSPIVAHDDRRNRGAFNRIRWPDARSRVRGG
jgi:hypothetical protein